MSGNGLSGNVKKAIHLQAMAHGADTILHFRWRTAVANRNVLAWDYRPQ